jgi:hypothetical protein
MGPLAVQRAIQRIIQIGDKFAGLIDKLTGLGHALCLSGRRRAKGKGRKGGTKETTSERATFKMKGPL